MDCRLIGQELVPYQLGCCSDEVRAEVEEHLLSCPACLRELFALKRALENGEAESRPTGAARTRLRAAVARELGLSRPGRPWAWWERPFAVALGATAVAVASIALGILEPSLLEKGPDEVHGPRTPGPPAHEQ